MHGRFLPTSSAVSALAIGGSLAGMLALSNMGVGAQGQSDFFLDAGGEGGAGGGAGGENGGGQTNEPTAAEIKSQLDAIRAERDTLKGERDDYKGKWDTDQAAKLTEKERLEKERDDANKERDTAREGVKTARAEMAVSREAVKMGIDPLLAVRLVSVTFDKDGQPQDVEAAVKELSEKHPELVKGGNENSSNGTGNPSNPNRSRNSNTTTFSQSQIGDRAFYEKNREAIMLAMREGRITND